MVYVDWTVSCVQDCYCEQSFHNCYLEAEKRTDKQHEPAGEGRLMMLISRLHGPHRLLYWYMYPEMLTQTYILTDTDDT